MKLHQLTIHNFKGIESFTLAADGRDVEIRGDNATGKTTIYDAFLWLLFGKDSTGRTSFEVKPLDRQGQPKIKGVSVEVAATIEHNGAMLTLRKEYKEAWARKNGESHEELTGHTTSYYMNDIPMQQREYKQQIDQIMPESTFRLLTDLRYFNTVLNWADRRKLLFELCGEPGDSAIVAANPALQELYDALGVLSVDDYKRSITRKMGVLRDELKTLPERIDEADRGIVPGMDATRATADKQALLAKREEYQGLLSTSKSKQIAEQESVLRAQQAKLAMLEAENKAYVMEQRSMAAAARDAMVLPIKRETAQAQQGIAAKQTALDVNARAKADLERRQEKLRAEWIDLDAQEYNGQSACPVCGQNLPSEQIEAATKAFNLHKADRLESLEKQGLALKSDVERHNAAIRACEKEIKATSATLAKLETQLAGIEGSLPDPVVPDMPGHLEQYEAIKAQIDETTKRISDLRAKDKSAEAPIHEKLDAIAVQIAECDHIIALAEVNQRIAARIEELTGRRQEVAAELERYERHMILCDEYTRTKVDLFESSVNDMFSLVRFKLFNQQINGGLAETCECTIDGVPYADLNNAAKINAGIDIINAFSRGKGHAPLFVDNAEAVVSLQPTQAQVIRLVVDGNYNRLEVA